MREVKQGSTTVGSSGSRRWSRFARYAWFIAAMYLFGVSSVIAFRQAPRLDAFARPSPLTADWWTQPIERNAPRRLPLVWGNLNDVFALRGTGKVWAVGEGGLVLHSEDYGRHWTRQYLVPPEAPAEAPKPAAAAWLGEPLDGGSLLALAAVISPPPPPQEPAGDANAKPAPSGASQIGFQPQSVAPSGGASSAAPIEQRPMGSAGTSNAQSEQAKVTRPRRSSAKPSPSRRVGSSTAQQSPPGTPPPVPTPSLAELARSTLWSVQFVDASYGWAAGDGGAIFSTADGGKSWERRDAAVLFHKDLRIVSFTDREHGLLVSRFGDLLETVDGGGTWTVEPVKVLYDSTAKVRWRVVPLVTLANGGPGERTRLMQVASSASFQNATRGAVDCDLLGDSVWAIEADGTLNRTLDGTIWFPSRVATPATLSAIHFAEPRHGWIVGSDGTLLATDDGGASWFRQSRPVPALGADAAANAAAVAKEGARYGEYSIWPAPLYYVSLLVVGLLLVPAFKSPPAEVDPRPSVASLLVSDRPIETGTADVFDFNAVALGLSRFLRNEKTEPPLTIAITGEWGSGKSSLMNLLRADLRRYGFRPVWFNAWHHQKEDHLLASLLEAIRAQAIPPAWRPEGMIYRGRLLRIRWARYWPAVAFLLLAFSVSAGYLRSDPRRVDQAQALVDSWGKKVGGVFDVLSEKPAAKAGDAAPGEAKPGSAEVHAAPAAVKPQPAAAQQSPGTAQPGPVAAQPAPPPEPPSSQHVPVAGLLLSALGLAVSVWKGMKGFGVDPASLLARDSGRIKDLQALTGFRQRFAAEFADVTRALNPRTMLILIDDLDRCQPGNVIEVLEAVNFLVSSGDCFVVMGMARERVMRCVGLSFKKVADELLDPVPPAKPDAPAAVPAPDAADLARQRRLDFAQQYLEKLINIEVPVPAPTGEQSRQLLAASEPQEETPAARRLRRRRELWAWTRKLAPFAGFALLLAAGFYYGLTRPPEPAAPVVSPVVASTVPPAAAPATSPGGPTAAPSPARPLPEPSMGEPVRWHLAPLALLALVVVGLGVWRLSIPPDVVVRDSREFEQALATWHPLLFAWRNTPRAIKRYLNRVRYLAMLQRLPAAEPALGRRFLDGAVRLWRRVAKRTASDAREAASPSAASSPRAIIPEDLLVALSAIDCCRPELLRHRDLPATGLVLALYGAEPPAPIGRLFEDPAWVGSLDACRGRYLEMASGIHLS